MADAWKLLLGNVDSKGNLENAALFGAKKQQGELASLLGSDLSQFATEEDMVDAEDESVIPEKLKSSNEQLDFEDEDELAEEGDDDDNQSAAVHSNKSSPSLISQKPVSQHEIERQKQEEQYKLEQKQLFEQKRKEFAQRHLNQQQKPKRTSAFADQYILYTDPHEGDVLRFTELFGPKEYQLPGSEPYLLLKKKKQRKKKKLARKKGETVVEEPQQKHIEYQDLTIEQDFVEKEVTVYESQQRTEKKIIPREIESDEEADNELSEEELETVRSKKQQFESEMFGLYPFDQIEWEREIRWGDDEAPQDVIDKDKRAPISVDQKSSSVTERAAAINDFHMLDFDGSSATLPTTVPDPSVTHIDSIIGSSSNTNSVLLANEPTIPLVTNNRKTSHRWGATDEDLINDDDEEAEILAFRKLQLTQIAAERDVPPQPALEISVPQPSMPSLGSGDQTDTPAVGPDGKKPRKKYTRRKKKGTEADLLLSKNGAKSRHSRADTNISTIRNKQLQYIYNDELLECNWLDSVMWDPEKTPSKPLNTNLILDLNDPDMIFEDLDEEDEEEKLLEKKPTDKEPVNPYNLSIDSEYSDVSKLASGVVTTGRRHVVKHSFPASRLDKTYFKTYLQEAELRRLHRPRLKFKRGQPIPVVYRAPKKEKKQKRKAKYIEKKSELSAHDHRVVLLEYIEQQPPMLNNVGMGTKVINYYKKKNQSSEVPKYEDGYAQLIDSQEQIPLLGPLKEEQFFTSIENQMYNAQIHKHAPPSTDFLLTVRKTSSGTKFYIRTIPMYYVAGHIQPNLEVPAPNSRPAINFTKNRLSLFIFRKFKEQREKGHTLRLQIDDIKYAFPSMAETSIRKRLKEVAIFNRGGGDSGWWIAKGDLAIPTENELQALVTPEMVCLNESMSAGQRRLEDAGVTQLASMASFASSHARLDDRGRIRDTIRFIEKETINTPWTRTTNFLNTLSGKESASLQVLGVVMQNLKPEEILRLSKETEVAVASEAESMLPTLTDPEARRLLIENGENEEKVRNMTRTDRKMAARKLLEAKNPTAEASLLNAISNKKDAKELARNAKFRQVLQQIFQKEAYKLSKGIEYYKDISEREYMYDTMSEQEKANHKDAMEEDEDDDDDEEFERDFQNLMQDTKKPDQNDEDEERELQEMFKKGGLLSNSTDAGSDSDSESDSEAPKRRMPPQRQQPVDKGKMADSQPAEKRYYVKKTVMVRQDDGTKKARVEIIRDPTLVAFYKQKKEVWEKQKNKKKGKRFFGGDSNDFFQSGSKEQRRLQDMFRRFKKMYDAQTLHNKKKKRRSTLAQTTYQATSAATDKRNERIEKTRQKTLARKKRNKEVRSKPKKNSNVSTDGSKIKITNLPPPPPPPVSNAAVDKPGGASASGLKIQIPKHIVQENTEENTKKRKAPPAKSTNPPAKKPKVAKPSPVVTRPPNGSTQDTLDYLAPKAQARKRRRTSIDQMAFVLNEIVDKLYSDPNAFPFQIPVSPEQFPDYKKIVSNPIDLSKIRKNITDLRYVDEKQFRKDFERMIENARIYCHQRFPQVVAQGEKLQALFESLMQANAEKFTEIMMEGVTPSSTSSSVNPQTMFNPVNK